MAKTPEQARAEWRRRAARHLERAMEMPRVPCECGCGTLILALKADGSQRRYATGHGPLTKAASNPLRAPALPAGAHFPEFSQPGRCRESWVDPEWFYADPKDLDTTADAKRVCFGCPIRPECLAWAMKHREEGVWGGLTRDQRAARRKRTAA